MILYLSSSQNTNLLDFERWRVGGNRQTLVKKMVGNFVLKQFVVYDMRNFMHITDIVLDRRAFTDTDEEFVEAIAEFRTMYPARVTVIYEGLESTQDVFRSLIESGVGNLVCSKEIEAIQQEIVECLSEAGMERYLTSDTRVEKCERYQFSCRNIRIAVVSSQARMGATTTAIGLCSWLSDVGAKPVYMEANRSGDLAWLVKSYGMTAYESGYGFEGVQYCDGEWKGEANFLVYDMGVIEGADREVILAADLRVFVCGTKPYELKNTMRMKKLFQDQQAFLLCPFTAEGIRGDIAGLLQDEYHQVLYPEYQPELTITDMNKSVYKEIIRDYIAGQVSSGIS